MFDLEDSYCGKTTWYLKCGYHQKSGSTHYIVLYYCAFLHCTCQLDMDSLEKMPFIVYSMEYCSTLPQVLCVLGFWLITRKNFRLE